jgi:hypothetical protein
MPRMAYASRLARQLAATDPERYVTSAVLAKRPGRLFIDYLRNGRGTTAIGPYSPRALPGFPVPAPVTWAAVEGGSVPMRSLSRTFRARALVGEHAMTDRTSKEPTGKTTMLETEHSVTLLTIMEIAGPIILACGLIYGIFFASRRRRDQKARGDAATRRLYQQKDNEIE